MEEIASWRANLDDIEAILASNPTDEDALARKETTMAYVAFLEEKERQKDQVVEKTEDGKPNPSESPMGLSEVPVDQMMTLFTIAITMKATSLSSRDAKDISEADAEAKRRCMQNLSTELFTLLQQLATDEAMGEFGSFLRCNGFTSMLDYGLTRFNRLKSDTIKKLAAEGYNTDIPSSDGQQGASKDTAVGDDGVAIITVAATASTTMANDLQDLNAVGREQVASNPGIAHGLPQDACYGHDGNGRALPQDAMGGLAASTYSTDNIQEDENDADAGKNRSKPETKPKKDRKKDRRKKKTDTGEAVDLESHIDDAMEKNGVFVDAIRRERGEAQATESEMHLVLGKCNVFLPILMQIMFVISMSRALHDIEVAAATLGRVIKPMMRVIARAQKRTLDEESDKTKKKVANIKRKFACGDVDQPVSVLLHAYDEPVVDEEQPRQPVDSTEEAAKAATKRFGKNPKGWMSFVTISKACQTIMSTLTNLVTMIRVYRQVTLDDLIDSCSVNAKRRMTEAKKKFEKAISKAGDKLHIGDMPIADIYDEYLILHTRPEADASIRLLAITLMGEITTRLGYKEWSHLFTAAESVPLTQLFEDLNRGQIKSMAALVSDPFFDDQKRRKRAARIPEALLYVHQAAKALGQNKPEKEKRNIESDLPLAVLCFAPSNFEGSGIGFLSDKRLQSNSVDVDYVEELLDTETDSTESEAVNELYRRLRSAMTAGGKEHLFTDISEDLQTGSNSTESLLSRYFNYLPEAVKEIEAAASEVEE